MRACEHHVGSENRLFAQVVGGSAMFIHFDQNWIKHDANIIAICRQHDFYETTCWLVPKRIFGVKNACRCKVHIDDVNIVIVRNPQRFVCQIEKC